MDEYQNMDPWTTSVNLVHGPLRGPGPWTIPRGQPLIFEDEFLPEFQTNFRNLKWMKLCQLLVYYQDY